MQNSEALPNIRPRDFWSGGSLGNLSLKRVRKLVRTAGGPTEEGAAMDCKSVKSPALMTIHIIVPPVTHGMALVAGVTLSCAEMSAPRLQAHRRRLPHHLVRELIPTVGDLTSGDAAVNSRSVRSHVLTMIRTTVLPVTRSMVLLAGAPLSCAEVHALQRQHQLRLLHQ